MAQYRYQLDEKDIPRQWYNVLADMSASGGPPPPPIHPATHEPIGPEALAPLFPMALIQQEVSTERFIDIPDEVLEVYKLWRPTPLYRAHRLERALAAREAGERRTILFNLSGHGYFDLAAYDQYLAGKLEDYAYPAEKVKEAMAGIPKI